MGLSAVFNIISPSPAIGCCLECGCDCTLSCTLGVCCVMCVVCVWHSGLMPAFMSLVQVICMYAACLVLVFRVSGVFRVF